MYSFDYNNENDYGFIALTHGHGRRIKMINNLTSRYWSNDDDIIIPVKSMFLRSNTFNQQFYNINNGCIRNYSLISIFTACHSIISNGSYKKVQIYAFHNLI